MASALALGARGRRFKSSRPDHQKGMNLNYDYRILNWTESIDFFLVLSLAALLIFWFLFHLPGKTLLVFLTKRLRLKKTETSSDIYSAVLPVFVGSWFFCLFSMGVGLFGIFNIPAIAVFAAFCILLSFIYRIRIVPNVTFLGSAFRHPLLFSSLSVMTFVFCAVVVSEMAAWWDGNYLVTAGHLARTGKYLPELSDGQIGMTSAVAVIQLFFPKLSQVTAGIGWAWLFVPLIGIGMFLLIEELLPKRNLGFLGLTVFLLPTAFKATEIRGSATGFALTIWSLLFVYRYLKTKKTTDLIGAVFALCAAWNFGQMAALFLCLFIAFWALFSFEEQKSSKLISILFWVNLLEWPFLCMNFIWLLGKGDHLFLAVLIPSVSLLILALCYKAVRSYDLSRPIKLKFFSPRNASIAFFLIVLLAFIANPIWKPTYNWYFFQSPASFVRMNFTSYGLFGLLFMLALLLAGFLLSKKDRDLSIHFLCLGFSVSCIFQILSLLMLKSGSKFPFAARAIYWDIWKDCTLHWNNLLMPVALAFLIDNVKKIKIFENVTSLKRYSVPLTAFVFFVMPTQNVKPYQALFSFGDKKFSDIILSQIDDNQGDWRGQQVFTLPLYLSYIGEHRWRMGARYQRKDCRFCTVHNAGFNRAARPIIDFLLERKIGEHESIVTADSILTYEHFLDRQVRYRNGVNTVCPIYVSTLDMATASEFYWKANNYIRRTSIGMAYTVLDPMKNLQWLKTEPTTEGGLAARFSISDDGEYEIYRGSEYSPAKLNATVNGVPLFIEAGSPSLGWIHLTRSEQNMLILSSNSPNSNSNPDVPVVLYPRRYWNLEKLFLEDINYPPYPAISLMRFTGIVNAPLTIEDYIYLMTGSDAERRHDIIKRYNVRFIIIDSTMESVFPSIHRIFSADPRLLQHQVAGTSIYEVRINALRSNPR